MPLSKATARYKVHRSSPRAQAPATWYGNQRPIHLRPKANGPHVTSSGTVMAVGAMLATVSAINADFFGAAKLPTILAHERQRPQRYAREIWGRHPAALGLIAGWAILISRYVDLHAISAAASAGFLIVFAMVNVGNAKLARLTGSRRWVSVLAAVACLGALGVMIVQILGQPQHAHAVWLIVGVAVVPFVYEFLYSAIGARDEVGHGV
jgi:L-asparagine transporter-like permease